MICKLIRKSSGCFRCDCTLPVPWLYSDQSHRTSVRQKCATPLSEACCVLFQLLAVHNDISPAESTLQVMVIGLKMNNNCSAHAFLPCLRQRPPHTNCCKLWDEKLKKTNSLSWKRSADAQKRVERTHQSCLRSPKNVMFGGFCNLEFLGRLKF